MKQNKGNYYIKFIIDLLRTHKLDQAIGLIFTLLYSLLVFLGPIVSQNLIDNVLPSGSTKKVQEALLVFSVIFILQPLFSYVQCIVFAKTSESICAELRERLYKSIENKDLNFFHNNTTGEIMSRLLSDTSEIGEFVTNIFTVLIKNVFLVISVFIGMMYICWYITVFVMLILVSTIAVIGYFSKKIQEISYINRINYDDLSTHLSDTLNNTIAIKVYGIKEKMSQIYIGILQKSKMSNIRIRKMSTLFSVILEAMTIICIIIIYSIGFNEVVGEKISLGAVIALALYFQVIVSPIMMLLNSNISFQKVIPIIDRIDEYLEEEAVDTNLIGLNKISETSQHKGDVSIRNLCFYYVPEKIIFNNYNLNITHNTFACVRGTSGVGKTTLIYLLQGLLKPIKGEITVDNKPCTMGEVLLVPQMCQLFHMSIINNIRCGYEEVSDEEIYGVCKKLNVYDDIMSLPDKFNTIITDQVNISGGQVQRVLIARAIIRRPSVLILDEPTSALDKSNRENVGTILRDMSKECTVIAITHDEDLMDMADEVIYVEGYKNECVEAL